MLFSRTSGICLCIWAITTASADATTTIDLLDLPGNQFSVPWGRGGTSLYAQSVVAEDSQLASVTMRGRSDFFNIYFTLVVTGTRPDAGGLGLAPNFADTRYTSVLQGIAGRQTAEITIMPSLPVAPGETLFLVFDTFSHPVNGNAVGGFWATAYDGAVDPYLPGEFLFVNTGGLNVSTLGELDAYPWSHRADANQDLGLRVVFTPEPTGVILMMFAPLFLTRRNASWRNTREDRMFRC